MTTASLMVDPKMQLFDNSGLPLSGGLVYTYQAGTLIPKATYQSSTMLAQNTNPVVLDSAGRANIWLDTIDYYYQIKVTDSLGNQIYTVDNVSGIGGSSGITSPALPWVNVNDYNDLSTAIAAIGAAKTTLLITDTQLTNSLTIPLNINLVIIKTGTLSVNPGQTVIINGSFEAGLYQVFSGTGTISFGTSSIKEVNPEWWGTNTSPGTTDMSSAIQKAIDSISSGVIKFSNTSYAITTQLTFKNYQNYIGEGSFSSEIKYTGTDDAIIISNPLNTSTSARIHICDIRFTSSSLGTHRGLLYDTGSSLVTIERCLFNTSCHGIILDQSELINIISCEFQLIGSSNGGGVWLLNGNDKRANNGLAGVATQGFTNRILIQGCHFNGPITSYCIIDDGGISHSFRDNNYNATNIQIRIGYVRGLVIDGGEFEIPNAECIQFTNTTFLLGSALSTTQSACIKNAFIYNTTATPPIGITGANCLISLIVENNEFKTTGNVFSGVSFLSFLDSSGNTQTGAGYTFLQINNKIHNQTESSTKWTASVSNPAIGNGTISSYWRRNGKQIRFSVRLLFGASSTFGSGQYRFEPPFPITTGYPCFGSGRVSLAGTQYIILPYNSTSQYIYMLLNNIVGTNVAHNLPGTFAAGDTIEFDIEYTTNNWVN